MSAAPKAQQSPYPVPGAGQPIVRLDRMMESLRYAEYEVNSGVGELVDNAVESGAQNIRVCHETEKKAIKGKSVEVVATIAVIDDGAGMSLETLGKCLVLGETIRPPKKNSAGIGKFGVGLTMGAVSLARRVEVYSRTVRSDEFRMVYLDLDEVKAGKQTSIPAPAAATPPATFAKLLEGSSGTIVVLTKCDRLQVDPANENRPVSADELIKGLPHWLGRTYRKFIAGGVKLWFGAQQVFLHDPLYAAGPTRFESKGKVEPKAKPRGQEEIELPITDEPGKIAKVTIAMTLLPKEWRRFKGDGGKTPAKERAIDENEGISILRANREVLYGPVPYIIGKKGVARFLEIDRWWGCEISFPPELDDYFHVRYIKRGAEPVTGLREQIRGKIATVVEGLRKEIQSDFEKSEVAVVKEKGVFTAAEEVMASADATMGKGKRGQDQTAAEVEKELDTAVEEAAAAKDEVPTPEEKVKQKAKLVEKPYSIIPVRYPANFFFETVHLLGKIIVKLNVNHPFYKQVFEPLCGTLEASEDGEGAEPTSSTPEQRRARDAFMWVILSYAKAEQFFDDPEAIALLENLRSQWGVALGAVITKAAEGR